MDASRALVRSQVMQCDFPTFKGDLDAQIASDFKSNTLAIRNRGDSNHFDLSCDPLFHRFRGDSGHGFTGTQRFQLAALLRFQFAIWASKQGVLCSQVILPVQI